jgi:Uma2 family endonuclease
MAVGQKTGVCRYRWTAKQLYRLLDRGFLRNKRVELVEGVILVMPAQKNPHAIAIDLGRKALDLAFGPGYWVRVQGTLDLSAASVVDPDLAVVSGDVRSWVGKSNPSTALLVVEVSDTTLGYDRHRKASLYARAGIADYWIINLRKSQLEVYRQPGPNQHPRYGYGYASPTILTTADSVTPLAAPQSAVRVADLLP